MQKLSIIRLAVLIVMRDLLIPGGGLLLAIVLPLNGTLSPWHLPLIAGMLGTPLVARGGMPTEEQTGSNVLPPGTESLRPSLEKPATEET